MICIDCRKASSQAIEGLTMCPDCLQAERERLQRAPQEIANWERFRKLAAGAVAVLILVAQSLAGEPIPDKSVVPLQIVAPQCDGQSCRLEAVSRGSAVAIDRADGHVLLLTARHCLPEKTGERMQVYIRGQWVAAECLRHSKLGADLALIQAQAADCEQLACISTQRTAIGQPVTIAGYLLGREFGARRGRITAIDGLAAAFEVPQVRSGGEVFGGSVFGGQSGCGVFDESGDLVGITIEHFRDSPWQGRMINQPELARFVAAAGVSGITGSEKSPAEPESSPRVAPDANPFRASPGSGQALPERSVRPPEDRPEPREPGPLAPEKSLTPGPASNQPQAVPKIDPLPATPINPPNISRILPVPELPASEKPQETQGSNDVSPPVTREKSGESNHFWASLIPLGISIAGVAASHGATWWTCIRPAMQTANEARQALQHLRGLSVQSGSETRGPQGCFTAPAPPVSTPQTAPLFIQETLANPGPVVTRTQLAPVEIDRVSEAVSYAFSAATRRYPNSAGTIEAIRGIANQYLSGLGHEARI